MKHIFHSWGFVLILAGLPISEYLFSPAVSGLGYGILWQIALGLFPAMVAFAMLGKQDMFPGTLYVAGGTYLFATVFAGATIWLDLNDLITTPGARTPSFHFALDIASAVSIVITTWLWVFKGTIKLRNHVLLWLKRQEWYRKVMANRINMNADGMHGLNWLMEKREARKKFPTKCGMILGIPNSPDPLPKVAFDLALSAADFALGYLLGGAISLGGSTIPPLDPIYYPMNRGMTILIGPPRTGKATSYAIVNLLNWCSGGTPDNPWVIAPFFVLDPKGELFAMTALARMRKGRRVIPLDFLGVLSTGFYAPDNPVSKETGEYVRSHRWRCNPFDFIVSRPSHFEASLRAVIEPLFPISKGGGDDFWNNAAKKTLLGFWAWISDSDTWYDGTPFPKDDRRRNPATAMDFLSLPQAELDMLRETMATGKASDAHTGLTIICKSIRGFPEVGMGLPKRIGNELERTMKAEKQWAGLAETIQVQMKWCDQSMREGMERSGCSHGTTIGEGPDAVFHEDVSKFEPYNFADLWKGDSDVYLIVPDEQLAIVGPWLRMMVCGLANVIKNNVHRTEGRQFVFLLDELAQVGGIEELKSMAAYAAGKGIHVVLIFQALAQMKEQYGQDGYNTLLACSYAKIFLGAADIDTAKMIGEHVGKTTGQSQTINTSGGMGQLGGSVSSNTQTGAVDILSLQQILGTHPDQAYGIFSREEHVMLYDKKYYYLDPAHKVDGRKIYPDPNPFDTAQIQGWKDKHRVKIAKAA